MSSDYHYEELEREKHSSHSDALDMARLERLQQLKRRYRFWSILSYSLVTGCTWEITLYSTLSEVLNGGTASCIWMYFLAAIFSFLVTLSLAEMVSMAPASGGPFQWVSEFAPKSVQRPLSYLTGCMVLFAWGSAIVNTTSMIIDQIHLARWMTDSLDHYPPGWQTALFIIALALIYFLSNALLGQKLHIFQGIAATLHLVGFIVIISALWAIPKRERSGDDLLDPKNPFTSFVIWNSEGYSSQALTTLVGLSSPVLTFASSQSAPYFSEETRNASKTVPWAMIASSLLNSGLGFSILLTLVFAILRCLNTEELLLSAFSYQHAIQEATGSRALALSTVLFVLFMLLSSGINQVTLASRQIFTLARDNALPLSSFFSQLTNHSLPLNALLLATLLPTSISFLLTSPHPLLRDRILLSYTSLFPTLLSLTYLITILSLIHRRLSSKTSTPLPASHFTLGKAGLFVNVLAVVFLPLAFLVQFFPWGPLDWDAAMLNAITMNYAFVTFLWVVGVCGFWFAVRGWRRYVSPVERMVVPIEREGAGTTVLEWNIFQSSGGK